MAKRTLLELTKDILSSLDSDEVNSITDTTESMQVATVIRTVYEDIIARTSLPEVKSLFELQSSVDVTLPNVMYKPANVLDIEWVKYNKYVDGTQSPFFLPVKYLPLPDFLSHVYNFSTTNDWVKVGTLNLPQGPIEVQYVNNKHPDYFTSFNDNTILFDSYNKDYDSTLQQNKSIGYGVISQTFVMADNFVPHLDDREFSLLYNEAKSLAWAELKQTTHSKAEQLSKRGWASLQKHQRAIISNEGQLSRLPNYARRVR